ncbi:arylsulfatase [Maricaulis maris]|nr:arylsulfatase [Maricaulis maris]
MLVVLVDDAAFMDFGAYGGEARTPVIDALAARGALFVQHRTTPLCAPSRAMLLTGLDAHQAGVATIPEVIPPEHVGQPGYTLALEPGVMTMASRLQAVGYQTVMAGKWHLGSGPGDLPDAHGFERSFALDASGADNWEQKTYMPFYATAPWFEDGQPASLPDDFYSSEFLVDQLMDYLGETPGADRPFFAYLAFQAIHIPIQVDPAYTDRYVETYAEGWDVLRGQRRDRAAALGFIPEAAPLAPTPDRLRPWASLTADQRDLYTRSMAVNAGMLEAMDHHLGRLVDYLQAAGALENTVILVTSDNGPEPSHPVGEPGFRLWMALHDIEWRTETLGERGTTAFIGPEWAFAAASPFDLFKFYASDGGLRVPLIAAGPGIASGIRIDSPTSVADIAPTVMQLAGAEGAVADFTGRSLAEALSGGAPAVYGADDVIGFEVSGNAALIRGEWKLVRNLDPWGDGRWRLFNIALDPGETTDRSQSDPEMFTEMRAAYALWAADVGVLEMPDGYSVHRQISINALQRQLAQYGLLPGVFALVLLGGLGLGGYWLVRRMRRRRHP